MYRRLYDQLNALPGIRSATIATYSPLSGTRSTDDVSVQGYAATQGEDMDVEAVSVAPRYVETMGMTLLLGRAIGTQDAAGAPLVAMVNEAFVRHFFPKENPIGKHFGFGGPKEAGDIEIVGVVKDAQFSNDVREKVAEIAFLPILQDKGQSALSAEVALRTAGDPDAAASEVRQAITQVDATLPVSTVQSLRKQVESNFDEERIAAQLIGFFSGLALLLACVGLYGIVAQGVARRTNEIGVRMALGAQPRAILGMVFRDTSILVLAGLAVGLPAAFGATRLISSQLYGVGSADPLSFAAAIIILAAVSALAGFLPARRAARVDPIVALRYE